MKYTLMKLILKTKIPIIYWVAVLIFTFMIFPFIGTVYLTGTNLHQSRLATVAVSIISLLIIIFSGFNINKSDNDFLLDIPLKNSEMLISYYVYNFLILYFFIVLFIIFFSLSINSRLILLLVPYIILLFLTCINIGIIDKYMIKIRMIIPLLFFIFLINPAFIGFRYSITSIFYGNETTGILLTAMMFLITFVYIIKNANKFNLHYREDKISNNIRTQDISGTPIKAIYMKNTFFINTIYVYKRISDAKIHTIRTNVYRSLVMFTIIGIIYFILNVEFYNTFILLAIDIYVGFLPGTIFATSISQWPVFMERPWLSLTSMNAHKYVKNFILSIILSVFISVLPFVLLSFLVLIFYYNTLNIMIFLYSLTMPAILAATLIFSTTMIAPIQITDFDNIVNFVNSGENLVRLIPLFILLLLAFFVSVISSLLNNLLYVSLYYAILLFVIFIMLNSKKMLNYIASKLINANLA